MEPSASSVSSKAGKVRFFFSATVQSCLSRGHVGAGAEQLLEESLGGHTAVSGEIGRGRAGGTGCRPARERARGLPQPHLRAGDIWPCRRTPGRRLARRGCAAGNRPSSHPARLRAQVKVTDRAARHIARAQPALLSRVPDSSLLHYAELGISASSSRCCAKSSASASPTPTGSTSNSTSGATRTTGSTRPTPRRAVPGRNWTRQNKPVQQRTPPGPPPIRKEGRDDEDHFFAAERGPTGRRRYRKDILSAPASLCSEVFTILRNERSHSPEYAIGCGTVTSVTDPIRRIHEFTKTYNDAKPFDSVATAQSILDKIERCLTSISG